MLRVAEERREHDSPQTREGQAVGEGIDCAGVDGDDRDRCCWIRVQAFLKGFGPKDLEELAVA